MGNSTFPSTLEGFGYQFKDDQLQDIKTGGPFKFNISKDAAYNQARYEALGELITEEVYRLLETAGGLQRLRLPADADADAATCVFASDGYQKAPTLLLLIHGSGVVRAGQWSRKLIINNDLDKGTQLPYIRRAVAAGHGVLVLNTNDNHRSVNKRRQYIPGNSSPEEHALTVWDTLVRPSAARRIAIVAHSYGGVVTLNLARQRWSEVQHRVVAVALTDSVHALPGASAPCDFKDWLSQVAVNWVASSDPLDSPVQSRQGDCPRRSAGHSVHEWTSWACMEPALTFLLERLRPTTGNNKRKLEDDTKSEQT